MVKLSILIATMPQRCSSLMRLLAILTPQLNNHVEVITNMRMDINIGAKRNALLADSIGEYVVFCDDDDSVSSDYIAKILSATATSPDCIGISGIITINRQTHQKWHISKEYGSWYTEGDVYFRTPNHISPVRRELALQAGFPEVENGEDRVYSERLLPLLVSEIVVEGDIYHYDYKTNKE